MASKFIESIRAKENLENMAKVLDSLPSVNPELSLSRSSTTLTVLTSDVGSYHSCCLPTQSCW